MILNTTEVYGKLPFAEIHALLIKKKIFKKTKKEKKTLGEDMINQKNHATI